MVVWVSTLTAVGLCGRSISFRAVNARERERGRETHLQVQDGRPGGDTDRARCRAGSQEQVEALSERAERSQRRERGSECKKGAGIRASAEIRAGQSADRRRREPPAGQQSDPETGARSAWARAAGGASSSPRSCRPAGRGGADEDEGAVGELCRGEGAERTRRRGCSAVLCGAVVREGEKAARLRSARA